MRPSLLLPYLGDPGTGDPVELVVTETSNGEPYRGWLASANGKVVGRLDEFKFDFVHFEMPAYVGSLRPDAAREAQPRQKTTFIPPSSPRFQYSGEWNDITDYLRGAHGTTSDAEAVLTSSASRIDIQLLAHQWSGMAMILLNGRGYKKIDLFNQENNLPRRVAVENPNPSQPMVITIYPLCMRNADSYANQVIIEGAIEYLDELEMPVYRKIEGRNHGGAPIEEVFYKYFNALPSDAIALDIGGGKRQIDDERYINLEYSQYEEPDMLGDGQALPFKSESVDLIYCTGVLEHIPDPIRATREMHRVLKPGGKLIACIPFLQPLHNDPQHFFNATPFGAATLFAQFEQKEIWWGGEFGGIVKWIGEAAHLDKHADPDDWKEFCRLAEKMASRVPYERLKFIASTVWVEAVKG
ncbi:methyltransferase domain-containing protein [Paraburkholderia sediminicola]|uniref:class I SAM-dependent methyltransferase n=1 Tax=Paraburkholderia sediminicola TaxID=458836 RepID=UPI0038BC8907